MGHNSTYSEDTGYVNIHGQDVKVYVCEKTGRILIPIDEMKEMGFRIYRKSQYSRLLIDDNQFNKEFDLYMLQSAQTYMLQNKIAFKENDILESINKCKAMLVGSQDSDFIKAQPKIPNNFMNSHVTETSPTNISITTKLREPLPSTTHNLQNDRMFKGFTQNKSPRSVVNEIKTDFCKQDGFDKSKTNFDQRKTNEPKFEQQESRVSFGSNKSFDSMKLSPRASSNNIAVNDGRTSATEQSRQIKFNQNMSNGVDADNKRDFGNTDEQLEKLATIELNKTEHHVLITHIEKTSCIWVQDIENADVLLDIDSKIKSEIAKHQKKQNYNKERTRLVWNKIYLAQHEGEWYRCKIIKFKPLTVSFVDYGNTAIVSDLKEVSEELAKIPCQCVRLIFSHCQYKPQAFDNILIRVIKKSERGTYSVEILNKEAEPMHSKPSVPPTPTLKTFFNKPQPLCKLENGQRVMIIGHIAAQLVLRTKETFEKLRQVEQTLAELDPPNVDKVEKGQLVVCNKDGKLHRAIVLNINGKSVEIELLDYYEKLNVDSESLKYISESLSKEPLTYIMTPPIKGYSEAADQIIEELIARKSKPTVVQVSDGQFDLKLGEELLSDKLKPATKHSDRPLLKDFEFFKPSLGLGDYILNVYRNTSELYFTSGEALEEHLDSILKNFLDDDTPHKPVMGEVCFGLYQESWSRCVVLRNSDTTFEVQFIDFGNSEVLKSDQLRKLTNDAKNTPVLAMRCKLIGLPPVKNVEELVKETVTENDSYEIVIKKFDGEVYEIEMPSVYKEISSKF